MRIEIGETEAAADQLAATRELAGDAAPSLLRAWLAAAHGEGLSAVGQRDDALARSMKPISSEHSRQAKRLASQIKSDRQLRRLSGLILPGSS
ncbi:hypothetical protein IQ251_14170 [Saccharopolyspora sp. HNM0983]|uniref:Uncharacterized protein n=1 Tax=Saccharopolyspora montiporae TaxID=2781240 RepID=A0A929BC15_9PSEU|nr:hypothetical protein [Saccharopolyspora sp. HNM0983]MBE9375595.1 hypothetical protein [Saccharopolyspora sp. HNM0983]